MIFGVMRESRAEKICNCGKVNPTDCCWEVNDGTLYITGTGEMKDYTVISGKSYVSSADWMQYKGQINEVNVQGISSIGDSAFLDLQTQKATIGDTVTDIGLFAFHSNQLSSIELPDSIKALHGATFFANPLNSIIIPDSLSSWKESEFGYNGHIICKGEKCDTIREKLKEYKVWTPDGHISSSNFYDNFEYVTTAEQCTGKNYYWSGTSCNNRSEGIECSGGYVKLNNNCVDPLKTFAKKHYTPAEANEWLHDGNNNFVILTFKK